VQQNITKILRTNHRVGMVLSSHLVVARRQAHSLMLVCMEGHNPVHLLCICVGPQLDWDPDIVAGLDVDFDYDDPDNVLEDDFVAIAEGPVPQNVDDTTQQEFE